MSKILQFENYEMDRGEGQMCQNKLQTLPNLHDSYVLELTLKLEFGICRVDCICVCKRVQLKSKLQEAGTCFCHSMTALQPVLSQEAFFHNLRLSVVSFLQGKVKCKFQKCYFNF
jgi:hypothetical protein